MITMPDTTPPHAVYGYARLSRLRPGEEGLSLDAQSRRITKRTEEYEWPLAEIFVEPDISARIPWRRRPQGHELFARLQPHDVVIITSIDRCFRSTLDALSTIEDFRARGIRLLALDFGELTEEGVCELIVTILAAVAEFERNLISERIRAINQHLRSQGKAMTGRPNFGYRRDDEGYLAPDPEQQEMIDYASAREADGVSYREIHRELNKQYGYAPAPQAIKRAIENRREDRVILAPHIADHHTEQQQTDAPADPPEPADPKDRGFGQKTRNPQ
jgi:DNA invertase Pin-like site-specific DNA recombinase